MKENTTPFETINRNSMQPRRFPLPFRYPGGKHYAIDFLRPFWETIDHDEYREPFVGGGSVFFNKEKAPFNWLNDLDHELITTYQTLSDQISRRHLVQKLCKETASKERWGYFYRIFKPKNKLEVAYRYYYLNRTSFSGKLVSAAWGYRPFRSLPPHRWQERIVPCGEKLEGSKITNQDFEDVINSSTKSRSVLMYVDPPYYAPPKKKHYRNGFDIRDHQRLCDILKATKFKFFLTYDDVPEVRKMYKWANIFEVKFFYRVDDSSVQKGQRRYGCELVISNYTLPKKNGFQR